ncbi:unnamed protein product, partial [marine sediment metagenome]
MVTPDDCRNSTDNQSTLREVSEAGMVNGIHHVTHYTGSDFDYRT